ncbi:MAG: signal peptidase I [Candidatus Pacearchaeota archaeon]|nr:signal peptidase I [Candidatus Pacearchaeota archaeon]
MVLKKSGGKIGKGFKKFWFLLWEDNSIKGWIFSMIFLFIFIKFIFFPVLNFATGTSLPLAIVESCSMYHQGNVFSNFNNWFGRHDAKYQGFDISKDKFGDFWFKRGFSKGDILFLIKASPEKLKVGDVIAFISGNKKTPVIHRIIKIEEENGIRTFTTIGDNNDQMLVPGNNVAGIDEREIKQEQLVGKAVFRIAPYLGWLKLIFFEGLKSESERGTCKEN